MIWSLSRWKTVDVIGTRKLEREFLCVGQANVNLLLDTKEEVISASAKRETSGGTAYIDWFDNLARTDDRHKFLDWPQSV